MFASDLFLDLILGLLFALTLTFYFQQEYRHVASAFTFTHSFLLDACHAGDVRVVLSTVTLKNMDMSAKHMT